MAEGLFCHQALRSLTAEGVRFVVVECLGDIDGDSNVGILDFLQLLSDRGPKVCVHDPLSASPS